MKDIPIDESVSLSQLNEAPYPIYKRMRRNNPIVYVPAANRIFLTKAKHTRMVKDNAELYSSDDPKTPMQKAFQAHTLMRKDGVQHRRERMAMQKAFSPKVINTNWAELYRKIAAEYLDRLPRGETIDLFKELCGPLAARILAHILGTQKASDEAMQLWSQALIDGAGNFGHLKEPYQRSDEANAQMNLLFEELSNYYLINPDQSAFSLMISRNSSAAFMTMNAGLVMRSCDLSNL